LVLVESGAGRLPLEGASRFEGAAGSPLSRNAIAVPVPSAINATAMIAPTIRVRR
jgi:hypothetical protein